MPSNLGSTTLRRRKRNRCPMQAYDRLPKPLRHWLAEASLPWSPDSAARLYTSYRRQGRSVEASLQALGAAEARKLEMERHRALAAMTQAKPRKDTSHNHLRHTHQTGNNGTNQPEGPK